MAKRLDTETQRKKSRDAARQRRGQQNDEFTELASHLPIPMKVSSHLDRLCVMRLSNSFVKMKHIIRQVTGEMGYIKEDPSVEHLLPDLSLLDALDGFVFVISQDGQCLYVSPNVAQYLGIPQLEMTGCSFYKYVHPCDQEELAQQLGGEVPLEDMEIFDGLFCSDLPSVFQNCVSKPNYKKKHLDSDQYRSFFIRMKSTLTSRGKSVNLSASIYRVIHCIGTVKQYKTKFGVNGGESDTMCFVAVGTPLLAAPTFDVPLDQKTFTSTHTLDFHLIALDDIAINILGYEEGELLDKSWYTFIHTSDIDIVKKCHDQMLQKGQCVSGFYRVLTKLGGWIWMKTKGNIVYSNTNFQPQYIININYVVSDVESREQILSIEQIQSVIKMSSSCCLKRPNPNEAPDCPVKFRKSFHCLSTPSRSDSSCSSEDNLALSRMEELEKLWKNQEHYEDQQAAQYEAAHLSTTNDDIEVDLPQLEVLASDSNDSCSSSSTEVVDLATDSEMSFRAPFVMLPPKDQMLYVPGYSPIQLPAVEKNSGEEESFEELAARAPFIPPPNDDTILTFDDMDGSPCPRMNIFDISESKIPELSLEEDLFDEEFVPIGPAIVPISLIGNKIGTSSTIREVPAKNKKKGDKKVTLPFITSTEVELNAPAGSLLQGDDLLSALAS
eukprot:gene17655-19410_t